MTTHPSCSAGGLLAMGTMAVLVVAVPLLALLLRTPWYRLPGGLTDAAVVDALWLSLAVSAVTACCCVVLGLPLAWVLARTTLPGRALIRAVVVVPLVLPPVVAGVALLAAFGRSGILGGPLHDATGVALPFTATGVVLAHTFIALPFFVLSAEGALRGIDPAYERVAGTLGAGRWTTLRRVTLPMAMPGLAAGFALSWARSLGEFGATITFAGNFPGRTQTLPLLVYTDLQADPARARLMSVVMLGIALVVLVALRGRWLGAFR